MKAASTYSEEKLIELMLYISEKSFEDQQFGKVKLAKLLFFSDFEAFTKFGSPITGASYCKMQHGPVPQQLFAVQRKMIDAGVAAMAQRKLGTVTQERMVPLRDPDLNRFTANEIALVDRMIDLLRKYNATEVSELSHLWMGWRCANINEVIPYETACLPYDPEPLTEGERAWAKGVAAKL